MHTAFSYFKKKLLFITLLFGFYNANAQTKYDAICFTIDSFANVGLPKSALKKVETLDSLARINNNAPQQIRAAVYRMTFQSYLEENALQAIITRLKIDINRADFPVKPVLQSLLAQMYWNYYQFNRYQFSQRTQQLIPDSDFTKWDLRTIINQTTRLYDTSLKEISRERNTPISVLDGALEGDSTNRYLRPTIYDLLVQRAFDFFLTDEPALPKPRLPFSLNNPAFFSDSRTFANLTVKTTDISSTEYKGMIYLQQASRFHLQRGDKEALADLDMQRLRFLYGRSKVEHKDSLYLSALDQIIKTFSSKPISSEAMVMEGQYYQGMDSLVIAHDLFEKAAMAWPKSLGGKNGATLIKQMEQKSLTAYVENINMPGKPILGRLSYKNLNSSKINIYKLTEKQNREYEKLGHEAEALDFLKALGAVQTRTLSWDTVKDYQARTLEFKIDPLEPGLYALTIDGPWKTDSLAAIAGFKVTSLVYITRLKPEDDTQVLVTDRETGQPKKGAGVKLRGNTYSNNSNNARKDTSEFGETDANGLYTVKSNMTNDLSINIWVKGDTLSDDNVYPEGAQDNSEEDKPADKTILFTDRQIYRPGQTIYFKALQLSSSKAISKITPDKELKIELEDANYKTVSTLTLKTNAFGTVSGSFIIPQTALDGEFILKTDDGSTGIRVEEYKRPSFRVKFSPVTESHKLNDSITIAGNVTAFSGYGLSQARVAYHIVRSQSIINYDWGSRRHSYRNYNYNNAEDELKTDTITTDNQGKFRVAFKAIPGEPVKFAEVNYNYKVTADVTDESGETHSGETTVMVGKNDLKIDGYIPGQLFAKDLSKASIQIFNLNNQPQRAKLTIEAYALRDPGEVFKGRAWEVPEQIEESRENFKNDFPGYTYQFENSPPNWPVLKKVWSTEATTDTSAAALIDLKQLSGQPSGIYRVVINARNPKGDTVSQTSYVNVINGKPKPLSMENWVLPEKTVVNPGDSARFWVGINHRINVLMERYNGPRVVSVRWMSIDTGVKKINIPITDTDRNAAVQFTMIYQNRAYSSYQKIDLVRPDKTLQLKFITFRDKLQPGQKEQWKLQLSGPGNKKPGAELLAGLYDASLDQVSPPQPWQQVFGGNWQYTPNYFAWNTWSFITSRNTMRAYYTWQNYGLLVRGYEQLSLFGYDYYGGYNRNYREYLVRVAENARADQGQEIGKGGRRITGVVIAEDDGLPIPGVAIKIKGTSTGVQTGSNGHFSIWVPAKGTLVFSYVGFQGREVNRFMGKSITIVLKSNSSSLGEVVVTGALGIKTQARQLGFATVTNKSLTEANIGDAKKIPAAKSEQLLQGQAAGVTVINNGAPGSATNVYIRGFGNFEKPIITPRSNFNETAFFYPQLHTDEKGQILIDFTIPESLTRWKFRALAHTKDLSTGYLEGEVVTQKQLSISANTPRFLREGDTITISARLANLTTGKLKGKVQLQLFNAVNMQPVSLFVNKADAEQSFEVDGNTNKAVSFRLAIPAGLDALDYKLIADAGQYTDGEENTLPVLPNRTLVTESMPMMVRAGQTKDFVFNKFVNQNSTTLKNKTLTLEYTSNPAWYAVQALPYMMEFPYECSEQTFSRYFANSLATDIVNKNQAIKRVFDQWKNTNSTELLSNLEKNQELKSTLLEETPWLQDAANETEQKKRIALLFDLNKMSNELSLTLDKLQKRQLPDGSFSWYGGDRGDRYITQHILEGIGELTHLHIGENEPQLQLMATKAIGYVDEQLLKDEEPRKHLRETKDKTSGFDDRYYYGDLEIQAWFARSNFSYFPMNKAVKDAFNNYLAWAEKYWADRNAFEQGMIALTMQRYNKTDVTTKIEKSLRETAQQSDELGMYWAKNQLGYFWYESPVETQSLLIELFTEAGDNAKTVDEMKIWLLRNKQTNNWQTTKATAAACYALLLKGSDLLADTGTTTIKLNGKPLAELKPDIKADAGTGYLKTSWVDEQIKPELGKVQIKNNGKIVSWGALHWQYLENLDKITSSNTNIHLQRKYFIQTQTDAGAVLTAVDATHQPKTGDLLKVVVYLSADRDFEYVQLKDMRPAGTEPVDALSTYKYQDGLYYYQVTKDVATNFFISELNKGSYVFEYRLRVAQPGNFSTGITSIQCMYAPEFNAHSEGGRMVVKP